MNIDDPSVVPVDLADLRQRYAEQAPYFISIFVSDTPPLLLAMSEATAARDLEETVRQAHSLKGICGTVCAWQMHSICLKIEERAADPDWAVLQELSANLQAAFDRLTKYVSASVPVK